MSHDPPQPASAAAAPRDQPRDNGSPGDGVTAGLLARARVLAGGIERRRLDRLADRLEDRRLRVMVAGEAKRGKSTLVNALLDRDLLPTALTPLTSVATTVTVARRSEPEHAVVTYLDGHRREIPVPQLSRFVTELRNPGNAAGVADVTVRVHSRVLEEHVLDLVDTPGTGSVFTHNTADARHALTTLDAAILVLTVDPPISHAERELLREITGISVRTFVLLNKSDRMTEREIQEGLAFTERVCAEITQDPIPVRACSARLGRSDPRFVAFTRDLVGYLRAHAESDTDRALRGHLRRELEAMLDSSRIRLRAGELAEQGSVHAVRELRSRLETIAGQRHAVTDRCIGSTHRLRRDLDLAAGQAGPGLAGDCARALDAAWATELEHVATDDLQAAARDLAAAIITSGVDGWRSGTTEQLERGLEQVLEQARADVDAQLQLARDAVHQTLGLTLSAGPSRPVLRVDARFRYDYTPPIGWAPPLQATLSRVGTATRRRRRVREGVMAEIPGLVDRQLGRARSDLQHRLQEAGRALARQLDRQLADSVDRLLEAMDEVVRDADPVSTDALHGCERLRVRVESLTALLDEARQPQPR